MTLPVPVSNLLHNREIDTQICFCFSVKDFQPAPKKYWYCTSQKNINALGKPSSIDRLQEHKTQTKSQ